MVKKQTNIWTFCKRATMVVTLLGIIAGSISFTVKQYKQLVKQSDMQKTTQAFERVNDLMGLTASKLNIDSKKSDVRWIQQQSMYEPRVQMITGAETIVIKEVTSDLAEAQSRHNDYVQRYEDKYNEKSQL